MEFVLQYPSLSDGMEIRQVTKPAVMLEQGLTLMPGILPHAYRVAQCGGKAEGAELAAQVAPFLRVSTAVISGRVRDGSDVCGGGNGEAGEGGG